ncbi:MAG: hypothetical protein LKK00_01950 [Intestinimonas sp.]|jgi:hypothetical protein|nr:hypothetical protein [Intestinimonas sp.]
MPYIDYKTLTNAFYSIRTACELFGVTEDTLMILCEQYRVKPYKNGFSVGKLKLLHYRIYHREKEKPSTFEAGSPWGEGPWND